MKILHVSKKYPQSLGGDAVVVSNLHKQQEASGHEVVIVTSNCEEIINADNIYKFGLKDVTEKLDVITPKRFVSLLILFFRMFAILRKERPDVIHTHSIDMAFAVSAAARFYGIPTVHTFHIVTYYDTSQSIFRRKLEPWLTKMAHPNAITAPNNFDVAKLKEAGFDQAVCLHNGVDLSFWQQQAKKAHGAKEPDVFTFVTAGRLEKQKGYEYLVHAVSRLTDMTSREFRVVIAGDGSQGAALRKLVADLKLKDHVTFVGRKKPEEVRDLLSEADVAVFSSLYDAMSIALLEVWAAGLPVIVTSVGLLRDAPVDFDAAYVVPPGDENALAQAMVDCMKNAEKRMEVARKGCEEVANYSWPVIAQSAEAVYRSVQ
jgi:glycosyltransferase involved in cell wall biosynthesis